MILLAYVGLQCQSRIICRITCDTLAEYIDEVEEGYANFLACETHGGKYIHLTKKHLDKTLPNIKNILSASEKEWYICMYKHIHKDCTDEDLIGSSMKFESNDPEHGYSFVEYFYTWD